MVVVPAQEQGPPSLCHHMHAAPPMQLVMEETLMKVQGVVLAEARVLMVVVAAAAVDGTAMSMTMIW